MEKVQVRIINAEVHGVTGAIKITVIVEGYYHWLTLSGDEILTEDILKEAFKKAMPRFRRDMEKIRKVRDLTGDTITVSLD